MSSAPAASGGRRIGRSPFLAFRRQHNRVSIPSLSPAFREVKGDVAMARVLHFVL